MFTVLPWIFALTIAAAAQEPFTDSDIASLRRLKNAGLLVGYPAGRNTADSYGVAVAIRATTRHLGQIVERFESRLAELPPGPARDQVLERIVAISDWRYLIADLRNVTVSRRYEFTVMEVDVDALLTSQSEAARRFLILTARANGPFADVPKDHWAAQAVDELRLAGILVGYPDLTFHGSPPK